MFSRVLRTLRVVLNTGGKERAQSLHIKTLRLLKVYNTQWHEISRWLLLKLQITVTLFIMCEKILSFILTRFCSK